MIAIECLLFLAGAYLSCYVAYWVLLVIVHFFAPWREEGAGGSIRFAILIPAHDEELLLPRLLSSLEAQRYPRGNFEVFVIADNCTDGTAAAARQRGAQVLERFDDACRGKGYALQWALSRIGLESHDAVLVVDADCFLDPAALENLSRSMLAFEVVQCYSGVGNPEESWFTRLLDVSRTLNNNVYSRAKQRLGLSCQLIGTGMCFSTSILRQFGWDAFTVGEDYEYFAKLIGSGRRVGFQWHAKVYHQESSTLKQATTQRMRWSSGRLATLRTYGLPLLWKGVIEGNADKFDAGLALLFPNPSMGMNLTLVCLVASWIAESGRLGPLTGLFIALAALQLGIFLVGVAYTKNRLRKLAAIFVAPAFLAWKMAIDMLSVLGFGRKKWIRTERKQ